MKKTFILLFALLFSVTATVRAQGDRLTLDDVVNYAYYPRGIGGGTPLADGESYARIVDGKRIVRTSFKTGKDIATLFDADDVRGDIQVKNVQGYIISPDERRILIQTRTQQIYRRSFTAVYYIYDIANKRLAPLSNGGPQQAPKFSPTATSSPSPAGATSSSSSSSSAIARAR